MSSSSSILNLSAITPAAMPRPRARTGIFKRNARKVEREMFVRTELAFQVRDKFPLLMSLLTIVRRMSSMITGI